MTIQSDIGYITNVFTISLYKYNSLIQYIIFNFNGEDINNYAMLSVSVFVLIDIKLCYKPGKFQDNRNGLKCGLI